jgi:5-carboxymethyl-2-hydroxymuconic-semialdehyde dehydrogenase
MASKATFEENLEKTAALRAEVAERGVKHIINGQRVDGIAGKLFETTTPIDNSHICNVAEGFAADIDLACNAAWEAFDGWAGWESKARRDVLYNFAELIEKNAEKISLLESLDTGQPIRFMGKAALRGAANFRYFADKCETARDGQAMPTNDHMNYSVRYPIGPVGIITPWNTPFMLSTWKIAPALAAGCTVVHKPAELSPVTAQILHELALEAGIPAGVMNMVNGFGETAGKSLTEHEHIKAVAFVGETTTGSHIMRQGADTLKRVHFELGGKNPVIVFADADLERALDAAIFMKYSLNGERCTSSSRLLVEAPIYDEFTEKLAERVTKIRVGNPLDPKTEVGPLIDKGHCAKVQSYVDLAVTEGATKTTGGGKPAGLEAGNYINPTFVKDANPSMRIATEEIFGPYLTAFKFGSDAEALKIANSTQYGLTAYIWTKDITRAMNMAHKVDAGMVWVNSQNVRHLPAPFGGVKYSGIGRDGGDYSFEFYMETKNICIAMGDHAISRLGAD